MWKRSGKIFILFAFILGLLFVRILTIENDVSKSAAATKDTRKLTLSSSRGYIYDKNLESLVNEEISEISKNLDEFVSVDSLSVNRYSATQLCSHLIGHLDSSGNGVMGLEKYYDDILNGYSGEMSVNYSVNALGTVIGSNPTVENKNFLSSGGIVLTIDKNIQKLTELCLDESTIDEGAVVVLDIKTSEILALASRPNFNQNNLDEALNGENSPFLNRAITEYAVGSIFKPIVASAAIEEGISPDYTYTCTGETVIGDKVFHCHKADGHGALSMAGATAVSCNTYYINLASQIPTKSILSLCENLGLGQKTELADNFYAESGNIPSIKDVSSPAAAANLAFGQGSLLATPLQMAVVYAAIANGGVYRAPTLMKAIVDEKKQEILSVKLPPARRVIKESTAKTICETLKLTVEEGSGQTAAPRNTTAAGKTATAQSGWYANGVEVNHSWFIGFFPVENPKYVIVVMKEDGKSGSADCAPVFKSLAELITATNN